MYYTVPSKTWVALSVNYFSPVKIRVSPNDSLRLSLSSGGEQATEVTKSSGVSDVFLYNTSDETKIFKVFFRDKQNYVYALPNSSAFRNGLRVHSKGFIGQTSDIMTKCSRISGNTSDYKMLGDLRDLLGMTKVTVIACDPLSEINISELQDFINLTSIDMNNLFIGDISSLSKFTKLTNLAFGNSHCFGTIESLIQGFRANGKTTGSMTGNSLNSHSDVTFNGAKENAKGGVTWTETTITMNGITVNA